NPRPQHPSTQPTNRTHRERTNGQIQTEANMSIVYDMPSDEYHANKALGSTSITTLADPELSLSDVYYRLHNREQKPEYDVGTLGHALILENSIEDVITLVPYDSYRTKAAREARDEAYKNGLIPVNE